MWFTFVICISPYQTVFVEDPSFASSKLRYESIKSKVDLQDSTRIILPTE